MTAIESQRAADALPRLHLCLLGGLRIEHSWGADTSPVPDSAWTRRSAKTLVKILAVEPTHRLHREQIQEYLWPDAQPEAAGVNLRQALFAARRALQPDRPHIAPTAYLDFRDDIVTLRDAHLWIDADEFEQLAQHALSGSDQTLAIAGLQHALQLYSGALLPEDLYAEWAATRREKLAALRTHVLLALTDTFEQRGDHGSAISHLREVLADDPAREDVHRHLMRLHVLAGSRHAALQQYRAFREALHELDVEPEAETEALHRDILTGRLLMPPEASGSRRWGTGKPVQHTSDATRPAALPALPATLQRSAGTPLLGRDHAVAVLRAEINRAREGNARVVLIAGEAGIGKTRLAAEAARNAWQEGTSVLWGTAYMREGLIPYGPLVMALDGHLSGKTADERHTLGDAYPELAMLIPALGTGQEPAHNHSDRRSAQPPHARGEGSANRLFAGLVRLLTALAAEHPLLLVLDDLHAADPETLQLVHHLAAQDSGAGAHPWLMVGTYREDEVEAGGPLDRLITALTRRDLCRRVDLLGLARRHSDELVKATLADDDADGALLAYIHDLALGNPLFTTELVRTLQERGEIVRTGGQWTMSSSQSRVLSSEEGVINLRTQNPELRTPARVRELVEVRVRGLGRSVEGVLSLAAVAGTVSTFNDLRIAADSALSPSLGDAGLLDALDVALERRLLEERVEGYAFRHPLIRLALYERLSQHRRRHLHVSLARAIETNRPQDVEALAYHYSRAEESDAAITYLERAGDRASSVYAHGVAEQYYRQWIAGLERLDRPLRVAQAHEKLGYVLVTVGRNEEAQEQLEQAVALYRQGSDPAGEVRATAHLGAVHRAMGTPEAGIAAAQRVLEQLGPDGPLEATVELWLVLEALYYVTGRYAEGLEAAERVADLARGTAEFGALTRAETGRGSELIMLGRLDEGLSVLEGAIALAEASGEANSVARALGNAAEGYRARGQLARSRDLVERSLALHERTQNRWGVALEHRALGVTYRLLGEWSQARAHLEQAIQLMSMLPPSWWANYVLLDLGALCLEEGKLEHAATLLEEGLAIARRSGYLEGIRAGERMLAELDLLVGRPESARRRLEPLLDRPGLEELNVTEMLPTLAAAYEASGDLHRAEHTTQEGIRRARASHHMLALVSALVVRGRLMVAQSQWTAAERDLEEAVRLAHDMPYPYLEAQGLLAWGSTCTQRGAREAASERLEEAHAIFQRLGAQPFVDRTARALAALHID